MRTFLLAISFLLADFAISHAGSPNAGSPSVLFMAIDDLNDWVGCLEGHPQVKASNIDALAQRVTLFTNAHCQAPICNPSRTSVMTGLRPSTTGVYSLAPWFQTVDELKELVTLHNTLRVRATRPLRTERWRYIQYADGSEELYDMVNDPNEFTNLAADAQYADAQYAGAQYAGEKAAQRNQLPKINKKPVPGSAKRILIYENGVANWEGEDIDPNEAIPD